MENAKKLYLKRLYLKSKKYNRGLSDELFSESGRFYVIDNVLHIDIVDCECDTITIRIPSEESLEILSEGLSYIALDSNTIWMLQKCMDIAKKIYNDSKLYYVDDIEGKDGFKESALVEEDVFV